MPLITVWNGFTSKTRYGEDERAMLRRALQEACLGIPELGLTRPEQVTVRFPDIEDDFESGHPIIIVVELLFDKPERTLEVRRRLATMLATAVRMRDSCKNAKVEVAVKRFDPDRDAFVSVE